VRDALGALALTLALGARSAAAADALERVAVAAETDRLCEASFREMMARERRLIEVSTRVRRAAVDLCGEKLAPVLGLQIISARDLPPAFLTPAVRAYALGEGAYIASVLDDSAAARAGLLRGDRIVSIDDFLIESDWDVQTRRAAEGAPSLRFVVERGGKRIDLDVPYEPGCYYQPFLALSASWNAFADRKERSIVVYSELVRAAETDDELAMVIGHELGHILLGHERSKPRAEADADYFGAYVAALAGYDPGAGARLWAETARTKVSSLMSYGSHPSAPERTLAVTRAVDEIRAKRAAGLALEPQGLR
jgi:Zn-dependent protease with chaperone function